MWSHHHSLLSFDIEAMFTNITNILNYFETTSSYLRFTDTFASTQRLPHVFRICRSNVWSFVLTVTDYKIFIF